MIHLHLPIFIKRAIAQFKKEPHTIQYNKNNKKSRNHIQTAPESSSQTTGLEKWKFTFRLSKNEIYSVANHFDVCYLANGDGELLTKMDFAFIHPFQEGLAVACQIQQPITDIRTYSWNTPKKYGALNEKGEIIIPFCYEHMSSFHEGFAPVKIEISPTIHLYKYIDLNHIPLTKPIYENAYSFHDGYAWVMQNGKWGIIDHHGTTLTKPFWYSAEPIQRCGIPCHYKG